jgi:hypothetical protein
VGRTADAVLRSLRVLVTPLGAWTTLSLVAIGLVTWSYASFSSVGFPVSPSYRLTVCRGSAWVSNSHSVGPAHLKFRLRKTALEARDQALTARMNAYSTAKPRPRGEGAALEAEYKAVVRERDELEQMRSTLRPYHSWHAPEPLFPWLMVILALPLGVTGVRRWWRERAAARDGLCAACGYDLRATPDRCPECGQLPGR